MSSGLACGPDQTDINIRCLPSDCLLSSGSGRGFQHLLHLSRRSILRRRSCALWSSSPVPAPSPSCGRAGPFSFSAAVKRSLCWSQSIPSDAEVPAIVGGGDGAAGMDAATPAAAGTALTPSSRLDAAGSDADCVVRCRIALVNAVEGILGDGEGRGPEGEVKDEVGGKVIRPAPICSCFPYSSNKGGVEAVAARATKVSRSAFSRNGRRGTSLQAGASLEAAKR